MPSRSALSRWARAGLHHEEEATGHVTQHLHGDNDVRTARHVEHGRDAYAAVHHAKMTGGNNCALFDDGMHESTKARLQLEAELRHAVERHEFRLHYQPIVSTSTGALVSLEALIRWEHPVRGCLPPSAFLEVLVASGMLVEVGRRIVAEACRQVVAWRGDGAGDAYDQFENDAHRRAIVGAIIQLAHVLGLDVVAEGVERPEQLDELRTLGCDFVQGFYLSPPLSSENIRRWIADGGRPVGAALLTP